VGKIERMDNKISFIGVGPGDPELLTLKALKKIKIADVIIWTDALNPEKILDFSKEGSENIKTSSLNLEQITSIMIKKFQEGKTVIRLHDGDPCLFGAIREQIEILKKEKIEIEELILPKINHNYKGITGIVVYKESNIHWVKTLDNIIGIKFKNLDKKIGSRLG